MSIIQQHIAYPSKRVFLLKPQENVFKPNILNQNNSQVHCNQNETGESNSFIQQTYVKLIKSDRKYIHKVRKEFYFK